MDLKNIPDIRNRIIKEEDYFFNNSKLNEIKGILISSEEYSNRMKEIGNKIKNEYSNKNPIFLYVLNGSAKMHNFLFGHLNYETFPHKQIYASVKSTKGIETGKAKCSNEIYEAISLMENKDILIFEDIIDSGGTIKLILDLINQNNIKVKSLSICTATFKIDQLKDKNKDILKYLNYIGFIVPNEWIVGRGLDLDNKYRDLKDICVLSDETIKKYRNN